MVPTLWVILMPDGLERLLWGRIPVFKGETHISDQFFFQERRDYMLLFYVKIK